MVLAPGQQHDNQDDQRQKAGHHHADTTQIAVGRKRGVGCHGGGHHNAVAVGLQAAGHGTLAHIAIERRPDGTDHGIVGKGDAGVAAEAGAVGRDLRQ